jgi:hypothetical protein
MNCLPRSTEEGAAREPRVHFAAGGGVDPHLAPAGFRGLFELMELIEMLCPRWPSRNEPPLHDARI